MKHTESAAPTATATATTGRETLRAVVVVGALGVVFGDIGTSPIYTIQTVFNPADPHPVPVSTANVFGVVSLVFWSVMIIVTLTYVSLVMRASNEGEGGIMALITLLTRWGGDAGGSRRTALLASLGIFGAALFFGDSMITPAISVLSAVEGVKVIEPALEELIVPLTAVIIMVLFAVQRRGTAAVGRLFGPVMIAWFVAIGACGVAGIVAHPEILQALSPTYAVGFLAGNFGVAFFALAVLLATAATVIASQAVITGAYSVALQAAQLGYLPRLRIAHTSESTIGQIYVPWINWMLMIAVLTLVFAFRSSAALAYAFGMAVITTITITTLLFLYLARVHWRTPLWLVAVGGGVLLLVDLLFLAANLTKLVHGAWLPLLIGLIAFTVMTTWQRGRAVVTRERERAEGSLREFVDELHERRPPLLQVPGTAIFLNRGKESAPLAMRANVEHNQVRHQHVVILSIETLPVPRVLDADRIEIDDLGCAGDGIVHVTAHFGYMEMPDVPSALGLLHPRQSEGLIDADRASYFVSKIELTKGAAPTMARWRKRLFIATSYITADAAEYFGLPRDRSVIMGSRIEV